MNGSTPESIYEFREFLYRHPDLIREVRAGKQTWNQIYQDWMVLGEEHEHWDSYRMDDVSVPDEKKDSTGHTLSSVLSIIEQINIDDLQKQISQFSGMMGNVQQVMRHFQKPEEPPKPPQDPFSFRRF
ncbi:spore coat protein YlbD [Salibacterium halotolerans]|uniref:Putative coat protein n=1 Tax=Salibacterium halotolerans TaxID=1884432 RepID=A0A1I5M3S1_9BACI|nr:spore coat protein YlbD [Salibacterium halotolerans]SFP03596.1 Putative coat protein [Salibacterium halotolerans]